MSGGAATAWPPARLLLADRDPALRRVLRFVLQPHGYQVTLADTAATALEAAFAQHPDLIVLDLSLPGVIDVIRRLRQAGGTPILLLTWPVEPSRRPASTPVPTTPSPSHSGIGQLLERLQTLRRPAHPLPQPRRTPAP